MKHSWTIYKRDLCPAPAAVAAGSVEDPEEVQAGQAEVHSAQHPVAVLLHPGQQNIFKWGKEIEIDRKP